MIGPPALAMCNILKVAVGCGGWQCLRLVFPRRWRVGTWSPEEAKQWYTKGIEWMEKHKPADEELQRFREAAELLGIVEDPTQRRPRQELLAREETLDRSL